MSTSLKITLSILLILQIIFIVRTLKRKKLVVKYASMWFLIIICLFVAIIFPNILIDLAKLFGFEKASNMIFLLGYFAMGLIFLALRCFYHLYKKNPLLAMKKDFFNLCAYYKKIIFSNPTKFKIIGGLIIIFSVAATLQIVNLIIFDNFVSTIIFFLMVIIFAPQNNFQQKNFPVEIFGFIYSIVLMYGSAGEFLVEIFSENNFFHQDMWIYGYCIIIISYLICMATVSKFMEHDLSRIEIIFIGMIMMTVLEFLTYYGIGFLCGMRFYNPEEFWNIFEKSGFLEWISIVINYGIYIASQSQILERDTPEILGYIILNGTDVLTVTAVLGYVLQKFMEIK